MKRKRPYLWLLLFVTIGCVSGQNIQKMSINTLQPQGKDKAMTEKPAIVYKTVSDFSDNVPVIMNAERTVIVSYPAPSDIYYKGKLALPTPLKNGYWLDNRGINRNVVFLNYTYEAYSKLKGSLPMNVMLKNIKEKYPLKELIYCGSRYQYKDEVKELNALIDAGFPGCKRINIIPMSVGNDSNRGDFKSPRE